MPNGIDNRSVSEILQNVTPSELRTICSALTPFIPNSERPQVLILDNSTVNDILAKYGLIERQIQTNPNGESKETITKIHPDFGKLEFYTPAGAGQIPIPYMDPTSIMDKTNESAKSIGAKSGTASPFDVITGPALLNEIIENQKRFDTAVSASWEDRSLIQKITKDSNGNEVPQFWTIDPILTGLLEERALKQASETEQKVSVRAQYTVILPPDTALPTNTSNIANTISGVGIFTDRRDINPSCASNIAELSANIKAAEIIGDTTESQSSNQKPLASQYALNSITKKAAKLMDGLEDAEKFSENFEKKWGGIVHNTKSWTERASRGYGFGLGGFIALRGLGKWILGNEEEGKKDISTGSKLIFSEGIWSPTTTRFVEEIVDSGIPNRSPSGRWSFSQDEFKRLKETEQGKRLLEDMKKRGVNFNEDDIPRYPIISRADAARIELELNSIDKFRNKITPIARTAEGIIALGKYTAALFGWSDVRNKENENESINSAIETVGPNGQIGIYIQSNGTMEVDAGVVTALSPEGNLVSTPLPFSVTFPPVTVQGERPSAGSASLISLVPLLPFRVELSLPDKIKLGFVKIGERIGIIDSNYPVNQQVATAIEEIGKRATAAAESESAFARAFKGFFETAKLSEIAVLLKSGPWNAVFAAFAFLPPTLEEFRKEYERRREEILRDCPPRSAKFTKEECAKKLKELDDAYESSLKQVGIETAYADPKLLLPVEEDPYLDSDVNLALEVETAKDDFGRYRNLMAGLLEVGEMFERNTSAVPPVDLSEINQNVSFVNDPEKDPRPYVERDTGTIPLGCFPSDVLIKTPTGFIQISQIKIGDAVISFNTTGKLENDVVTNTFIYEDREIYRYSLSNNEKLDVTKEHPVLTKENVFEEIGKLSVGDYLIDIHGNYLEISSVEFLRKDRVYNIEVGNNHTYIANNIRVHNKTAEPIGRRKPQTSLALLISAEFEEYTKEWLKWIEETFPGVLEDGWPVEQEYPEVPGVGGDGEPTEPQEPVDTPEGGIPGGGTEPDTPQEGPVAVGPGTIPNVPLEIIFDIPDPILDPDGYENVLRKAGVIP